MALRNIAGVESVAVSLDSGVAVIRFKPDNQVSVERVREAIRRNGFTPKSAGVHVRGVLVVREGKLALALPGSDQQFPLVEAPDAGDVLSRLQRVEPGTVLAVTGVVPETGKGVTPTLQVKGFAGIP